ncbi:four-carbon acid sugar kinase family protein [Niabella yanshanensis]|uniref:Four-carbon acid sugar kinase family protein n=1 Tax=Niabella yanshanensis TaxID=577386 RepID=A0ABZ0W8E3_9BACT|nr:four-carbon acid sugar kinase family protein [Niabella yanshanensis]WQD39219.1 four-carbon acid sugar kinase family protein [Niabella yanshanensis]
MIVVIADDFTGAAELAGISLGYGLKVSLCLDGSLQGDADVYIISTDSRSMQKDDALQAVKLATQVAVQLQPDFIFKKTDSVLRGYVADELNIQMEVLGIAKALILPANPSLGRTIRNGQYLIDGIAISHTGFAKDPEFAIQSSDIAEMLDHPVKVLHKGEELFMGLNIVSSAASGEEVDQWAARVDACCIAAGSGDFFEALLKRSYKKQIRAGQPFRSNAHVYVSGTSFNKSVELIRYFGSSYTAYIGSSIMNGSRGLDIWAEKAMQILQQHQQLIVAFDETINPSAFEAAHLRLKMAEQVKRLAGQFRIDELLIEGGATAAAIFHAFGINCFEPVYEWERGVVQMKAGDMLITVKPGSYNLPEPIRQQYKLYEDV